MRSLPVLLSALAVVTACRKVEKPAARGDSAAVASDTHEDDTDTDRETDSDVVESDTGDPIVVVPRVSWLEPDQILAEGAGEGEALLELDVPAPAQLEIAVEVDGTAAYPLDHDVDDDVVITVAAGATTASLPFVVVDDAVDEDVESLAITLVDGDAFDIEGDPLHLVTIEDDDPSPVVSVLNAQAVLEGDVGTSVITFVVGLDTASDRTVTVDYGTVDGTALADLDYIPESGQLAFPPGQVSQPIEVRVLGDTASEPDEDFAFAIGSPANATLGTASQTATVLDDDDVPEVRWASETQASLEGGQVSLTVLADVAVPSSVAIPYTVSGTADASDHDLSAGTLTIAGGAQTASLTFAVTADLLDEPDETIVITLGTPGGATLGSPTVHTVSILDDDDSPTLSVSAGPPVTEGQDSTFVLTLDAPSGRAVGVDFATVDGSAGVTDFAAASGTVTFPPGATSRDVTVTTTDDALYEHDEDFQLVLSAATDAVLGTATAAASILDDDPAPTLSFVSPSLLIDESDGTAVVTMQIDAASGVDASASILVSGTAQPIVDHDAEDGIVTIPAGDTSVDVVIGLVDDGLYEPDETIVLDLASPSDAAVGSPAQAVVTVIDTSAAPVLSVGDASVAEGDAGTVVLSFPVSTDAISALPVQATWSTADLDATAGVDYIADAGTVTVPAGTTSSSIDIVVNGDGLFETNETLSVTLDPPTGATLGSATAIGTIVNDDGVPNVAFDGDQTVAEVGSVTITATLDAPSGQDVTVPFTVGGTATHPADHDAVAGVIFIGAGSLDGTTTFTIADDALDEDDETVIVTMGAPTNAAPATPSAATITITDDDALPTLAIADLVLGEADGTASLQVSLSPVSGREVRVDWTTQDGSATAPADYTAAGGTLVLPAGTVTASIDVDVVADALHEPDETLSVDLTAPVDATVGTATGTTTITDDDAMPEVSWSTAAQSVLEAETATLTATLSAASGLDVLVPYTVTGVLAPEDHDLVDGTLVVPAGATSASVAITPVDDALDEDDETVSVTMGVPTGASALAPTVHDLTLVDDDDPPTADLVATPTVSEGDAGTTVATFTVDLDAPSGRTVLVDYATADGTATEADSDYLGASGTLTFAAGTTTATVDVDVVGDTAFEGDEDFALTLTGTTNAVLGVALGAAVITNDDPLPGPTTFTFTGAPEAWVVPAGVTSIHVEAQGAPGSMGSPNITWGGSPGQGGYTEADVAVTPGETLTVLIGGPGTIWDGGYNGGGNSNGPTVNPCYAGGGGGGASEVRRGATTLVGAGGGGGGEGYQNWSFVRGGNAGGGDGGTGGTAGCCRQCGHDGGAGATVTAAGPGTSNVVTSTGGGAASITITPL